MGFALDFERRTHKRDSPDGEISREPKAVADVLITGMLDLHFITVSDGPRYLGNMSTLFRKGCRLGVKFTALLHGRRKLAGNRAYHFHRGNYITYERHILKSAKAWKVFSP